MIALDHHEFNITERDLYYQEKGYLSCKNIDLLKKGRYRKRKRKVSKNKVQYKKLLTKYINSLIRPNSLLNH